MHVSLQCLGHVGQLRFCLRQDIDPSSYGSCQVEEVDGRDPHGSDVLLIAKRRMADPEPIRVICLVPAVVCWKIRASLQHPVGDCARRPIGESISKNITVKAPRCYRQGIISSENLAYLTGWIEGSLPRIQRPASYQFLNLCRHDLRLAAEFEPRGPFVWRPQRDLGLSLLCGMMTVRMMISQMLTLRFKILWQIEAEIMRCALQGGF